MRAGRPQRRLYRIEGELLSTSDVAAELAHLPYGAVSKRLQAGLRTWDELAKPLRVEPKAKPAPTPAEGLAELARRHLAAIAAEEHQLWMSWRSQSEPAQLGPRL